MSIINDALKKAEQEGLSKPDPQSGIQPETQPQPEAQVEVKPQVEPQPLSLPLKEKIPKNKPRRIKFVLPLIGIISAIFLFFLFNNLLPKKTDTHKANAIKRGLRKLRLPKLIQAKSVKATMGLSLSGIVSSEEGSLAIINDRIVRIGDTIGEAKLLTINDNFVELSIADKKFILNLTE